MSQWPRRRDSGKWRRILSVIVSSWCQGDRFTGRVNLQPVTGTGAADTACASRWRALYAGSFFAPDIECDATALLAQGALQRLVPDFYVNAAGWRGVLFGLQPVGGVTPLSSAQQLNIAVIEGAGERMEMHVKADHRWRLHQHQDARRPAREP